MEVRINAMKKLKQWLQFFEQISCFYRQMLMLPLWSEYNHATDVWDSLAVFLEGYAFERQGRRPDYSHAAFDALFACKRQYNGNLSQNVVSSVWQQFQNLLNSEKLNPKNNPLYPSSNPSNLQNISKSLSLIEVVLEKVTPQNILTTYFQNQIDQNNIQPAFNLLKSIRGIGPKIASFYLRDLVDVMSVTSNNTQNVSLLQPIDTWVERTVKILCGNQAMDETEVADWIVKTSIQHNINPQRVNMGIWFFGSTIVESEYRLKKALNDLNYAQKLVNDFRSKVQSVGQHC